MATEQPADSAATVIIGAHVRPGCERDYLAWQHGLNGMASRYPGFIAAQVDPPTPAQPQWSVVYRFDSVGNLRAWLDSATRRDRLAEGRRYLDGPPTQQIVTGGTAPRDTLVTAVVTHRVPTGQMAEFLSWQQRLRLAENKFPGYRGSGMFRPIEGVQDEWTTLYRYDSAADLDRWLTSTERRRLLDEGKRFGDFRLGTVDSSFGSWFAFDESGRAPSRTKTAIAVWVGLYPTVVLLTLAMSPAKLPIWVGMLVGNLLSSCIMTFFAMPRYVNPLLKRWLEPAPGASATATNVHGVLVIAAVMTCWAVLFWLVTAVFWRLP